MCECPSKSQAHFLKVDFALAVEVHVSCGVLPPLVTWEGSRFGSNVEGEGNAKRLVLILPREVGLGRSDCGHVAEPRWENDQMASLGRVKHMPAKRRSVAPRVSKAEFASCWTDLGVEDGHMVLPHVGVRPMKLARSMHSTPIKHAVVQIVGDLWGKARSYEEFPAEPLHDLSQSLVLRQRVHFWPGGVIVWIRSSDRWIDLQRRGNIAPDFEKCFLPVEKAIIQSTGVALVELVVQGMFLRQSWNDVCLKLSPTSYGSLRQVFVEGRRLPTAQVRCYRHYLHVGGPKHVNCRGELAILQRLIRFEKFLEGVCCFTMGAICSWPMAHRQFQGTAREGS
mmetsp:Transcript_11106/g.24497  ORF Transcript_11106/g.24497 Transcript_11106/m.24497 type:complete len:338 (-) Transcript_11106:183-1196(-)